MSIAPTVSDALASEGVEFDLLQHAPAYSSAETARLAGISPRKLAKAVLLKDPNGYILAVAPADHVLDLDTLRRELHRPLAIAGEQELDDLFCDCSVGAVPPIGSWYRVPTVVDARLRRQPDIYFRAGDHESLVHVTEPGFESLLGQAEFFEFSRP